MYNIIAVIFAIIIPIFLVRKDFIKKENLTLKEYIKNNKYFIVVYFIILLGFLVRLVDIGSLPAGLNQDEASAGYESYALAKYGIDRNNKSFPVHFIAWGSGQNVLYSYILIPFILVFGLNTLTLRIPMAIIGCISLVLVYKLVCKKNKTLGIIALAFFAICPWHIMKSRWALESNLFPDLVLIAVYIIIRGLQDKKMYKYYIGIALLALSVYSYGTAYMFLPIFIVVLQIYLLKTKAIKFRQSLITCLIAGIIALPMILFVIINSFDLDEIKLGFITIPRLKQNRYESITNIFTPDFLKTALDNFVYNIKIIFNQYDGYTYNAIKFYGLIYIFSLPFTIIGLFKSIFEKKMEYRILNIFGISSFLLLFVLVKGNINRFNICIIPIIMYTIIGIYEVINNNKRIMVPLISLYSIAFISFCSSYMDTQGPNKSIFTKNVEQAIKYADSLDVDKVYIADYFIEPYIYTLFYTQSNPHEFADTVQYFYKDVAFEKIKSFGKYYFYLPSEYDEENVAYIIPNAYTFEFPEHKMETFEKYTVVYKLKE